jgi:hypothetical protein
MNQREIILAGLAPAKGAAYTPVQVQKLFFLIDRNIPEEIEGPLFNFQPYNYGPFDRAVYDNLLELTNEDFVDIDYEYNCRTYKLTVKGQEEGDKIFRTLPEHVQAYIDTVSKFVRSLSFTQLVRAIYNAYPEMKQNSVFQE